MTAQLLNHRYRVLRALGEGGFGRTYLAEDTHIPSQRRCVVKQLKPKSAHPEAHQLLQDRFAREAAVLEAVGSAHDQIPTLYAYFVKGSKFYLVQEWIEGQELDAQLGWTEATTIDLLVSLLETLSYIHSKNIIHRDIKPKNIILRQADNLPCLIDFGAVKEVMSTVLSPAGTPQKSLVIGTPGFMPPEQLSGQPVFASDLYSLALTAVALITERSPAKIPTDSRTGQVLWQQYAPPDISNLLLKVLTKATQPQAGDRYATAQEMLSAIAPPPKAAPPTATQQPAAIAKTELFIPTNNHPKQTKKSPVIAGLAIASLLGIGFLIQLGPRPSNELVNQPTVPVEKATEATDSSDSHLTAAETLYEQGQEAAALEEIALALEEDPGFVEAIALKADILANQTQRNRPGAIALYTQALAIEPNNLSVLTKRCKTYAALQDWSAANADCTRALEIDPDSAELYDDRGNIHTAQQDYEGALSDYSQAIDLNASAGLDSQNQSLYYRRHEALGKLERYEEALADLKKARGTAPSE